MPSGQNKTEQPTARRLEKARGEGFLPQSQEIVSAFCLLALIVAAGLFGPFLYRWAHLQIRQGLSASRDILDNSQSFVAFWNDKLVSMFWVCLPFWICLIAAGVAGCLWSSGWNFSVKSAEWKLDRLDWIKGLKQLFSPESLVRLGLSVLKLVFIGVLVWLYLWDKIERLAAMQWLSPTELVADISWLILGVCIRIGIGILVIALIDLLYQKWRYIEQLKMTKQEVKEEYRDTEGAPEVKSRIRRKQIEAASRRMLQEVPKANVVLVNPTHVAVALRYDPATMTAPIVVAKGGDHMCEKIKEIARAYGVPIIRRPALARELYTTVKIGKPIPEKLFTAVAEVLALIYRLRKNR